jgi:hypothetical protein
MRRHWYVPAAILLVLAIAVFLVGWLQLSVPSDSLAVAVSRHRGVDPSVVRPGGFTWRWERLIPQGITLYRFPVSSRRVETTLSGLLPSGEVYAAMVPERPDFSWEIRLSAVYRIRPEALPGLVDRDGLRPEGLEDWYRATDAELGRQASAIVLEAPADDAAAEAEAVARELPARMPSLELSQVSSTIVRMPDRTLYAKLKAAYLAVVDAREHAMTAEAGKLAADEAAGRLEQQRHERTIAILARYGELLDKYPALIKFLFLTTAGKLTAQDLQTLDILGSLVPLE